MPCKNQNLWVTYTCINYWKINQKFKPRNLEILTELAWLRSIWSTIYKKILNFWHPSNLILNVKICNKTSTNDAQNVELLNQIFMFIGRQIELNSKTEGECVEITLHTKKYFLFEKREFSLKNWWNLHFFLPKFKLKNFSTNFYKWQRNKTVYILRNFKNFFIFSKIKKILRVMWPPFMGYLTIQET